MTLTQTQVQRILAGSEHIIRNPNGPVELATATTAAALARLALANLETQAWLIARSGEKPHNHAEVEIIKRLRRDQP